VKAGSVARAARAPQTAAAKRAESNSAGERCGAPLRARTAGSSKAATGHIAAWAPGPKAVASNAAPEPEPKRVANNSARSAVGRALALSTMAAKNCGPRCSVWLGGFLDAGCFAAKRRVTGCKSKPAPTAAAAAYWGLLAARIGFWPASDG